MHEWPPRKIRRTAADLLIIGAAIAIGGIVSAGLFFALLYAAAKW